MQLFGQHDEIANAAEIHDIDYVSIPVESILDYGTSRRHYSVLRKWHTELQESWESTTSIC
jgi:hypothetical protein